MKVTETALSDDSVSMRVANEVRAYLARRRISARRAAAALGWGQRYLSRRLTADVPFDVEDLAALAELLDVEVTDFFRGPQMSSVSVSHNVPYSNITRRLACMISPSVASRWHLAA